MEAQRWLRQNTPGYEDLTMGERNAIRDFALLWSYFESLLLGTEGNAKRILETCTELHANGRLQIDDYRAPVAYFRRRYFDGAAFTPAFTALRLRGNDKPKLVQRMLCAQAVSEVDMLSALLIIILRLRNNLFHGVKWSYGIRGQKKNFTHANETLMSVLAAYLQ